MTTSTLLEQPVLDDSIDSWAASLVRDWTRTSSLTIGLTSGNRQGCDRRVIDAVARSLDDALSTRRVLRPMLLVRMKVMPGVGLERGPDQSTSGPPPLRSPLGTWSEVSVPVPVGKRASWSLEQLPRWINTWQEDFGLVVIDMGPMHEVPSRAIGRLCDGCYVVLGPDNCASREWILQQVAWHQHSGSTICGTLVCE